MFGVGLETLAPEAPGRQQLSDQFLICHALGLGTNLEQGACFGADPAGIPEAGRAFWGAGVPRHLARAGSGSRGSALFILHLQRWERKINPLSANKSGESGQVGTETLTVLILFAPPPRGLSSSNTSPSSGMSQGAARAAMGWRLDGGYDTPKSPQ